MGENAREFLLERFLLDTSSVDVMIGYQADDSYFSFAQEFVNNTISLRDLSRVKQLGTLGEQIVLLSERAFQKIEFIGHEVADYRIHYFKRAERDQNAWDEFFNQKKNVQQLKNDILCWIL